MSLSSWWRRTGAARVDEGRWLVVDTETSGLDPGSDRLLAIAAVAVRIDWVGRRAVITPGDSFEVVIRQDQPTADHANILLHGIGVQRQGEGVAPRAALDVAYRHAGEPRLEQPGQPAHAGVLRHAVEGLHDAHSQLQ